DNAVRPPEGQKGGLFGSCLREQGRGRAAGALPECRRDAFLDFERCEVVGWVGFDENVRPDAMDGPAAGVGDALDDDIVGKDLPAKASPNEFLQQHRIPPPMEKPAQCCRKRGAVRESPIPNKRAPTGRRPW